MVHNMVTVKRKLALDMQSYIQKNSLQPAESSPNQVMTNRNNVKCKIVHDHLSQQETPNSEVVGKDIENQSVPEDIRRQINLAIEYIEKFIVSHVPTNPAQLQDIAFHQVPILDKRVSELVRLIEQVQAQFLEELVEQAISVVRVGNEWAIQIEL